MANLRDLLTVTGPAILLKLDSNNRFFSQCDLEIWWMISKNNRALLLYYINLCASFQIHRWIQTGGKSPETLNLGRNWQYFVLCDLEIWWMTLKNKRAPLLYYMKLCASFQSQYGWIQTGVKVQKRSIRVKIGNFLSRVTLKFDGWPWKKRAPLRSNIKLCASFHQHMWIQTGVTVGKGLNGFMTSVTLTFDLDHLHGHHAVNGNNSWKFQDHTMTGTLSKRCDGRTDGRTDEKKCS